MPSSHTGEYTRRDLLRTSLVVGMASLTGCLEKNLASASPPEPGTWPLARYGPRNTAHTPNASPPTDPTIERFPTTQRATSIVVGRIDGTRRIVVGGYDGLTAHRYDGTVVWQGRKARQVAVRPDSGVCYAAGKTLRALSLADGTVRWSTDLPGVPIAIVPSSRGPFVPFNGGIDAYDRDGNRRYRIVRGEGTGQPGVAIADAVYVTDVGMAERLSPRGILRRLRDRPPAAAWHVEQDIDFGRVPIVDDSEVYITHETFGDTDGGVLALDTDGTVRWNRNLGKEPTGAALGPDRLFIAMTMNFGTGLSGERLYALRRADGTTDWEVSAFGSGDGYYTNPVIAGNTVLVSGTAPNGDGFMAAYALGGEQRWTRRFDTGFTDITPINDRIHATTYDGSLYVLS